MEISQIKNHIQSGKFNSIYYFIGEEYQIIKLYIDKIVEKSNTVKTNVDSIEEVASELKKGSNLFDSPKCFVVRNDEIILNNPDILNKLAKIIGKNLIIFTFNSIDKRSKFYKNYKNDIVEFNKVNEYVLIKWIMGIKNVNLTEQNIKRLLEICEYNYGRVLIEINKLQNYIHDMNKGLDELITDGIIYKYPEDCVFKLVDAILTRNILESYKLYNQCKAYGEANLVIISNLFNSAKQVLQVQACEDDDVAKVTGLTSVQIWSANKKINHYSIRELINIMKISEEAEYRIKIGTLDEDIAIDYILAKIFN